MNLKRRIQTRANAFLVYITIISIFSCTNYKDYPSVTLQTNDPISNFEAFWVGVNDNYIFFSYDNLNWDDVYNEYRPQITANTSNEDLLAILYHIMLELIDGHALIRDGDNYYTKLNSAYRKKFPQVDFDNIVRQKYLDTSFIETFNYMDSDQSTTEFYFSRFKGKNANVLYMKVYTYGTALDDSLQNQRLNNYLSQTQTGGFDGLILDLRNNGGGYATEFKKVISKFVKNNYTWGYSKFRLGRDRYEMTPFLAETANFEGLTEFTRPLVILTDRYSFSAAELTTLALKNLANVTIIGDTTGGAEGPIYPAENDDEGLDKDFTGNFKLPNGWVVQLAQKATFDSEKNIYEGKGIPPDLVVIPSTTDAINKIDNVLEAALNFLNP